jgi:hypothetical protein
MRGWVLLAASALALAQEPETPTFGVSVVLPAGLTGQIYKLPRNTQRLPDFRKLNPVGVIYTHFLAVPPRPFTEGFPGVPDLLEWFAIDYTGRFWVEQAGQYRFRLTSDDGSRLWINGLPVIDNDGQHAPQSAEATVLLDRGAHDLRVAYFQGPRFQVALQLEVQDSSGKWRVFSTLDFRPPKDLFALRQ